MVVVADYTEKGQEGIRLILAMARQIRTSHELSAEEQAIHTKNLKFLIVKNFS
jgi:hypothetical protein